MLNDNIRVQLDFNFRREHTLYSLDEVGEEGESESEGEDGEDVGLVNKEEEEDEDGMLFLEEQKSRHDKFSFLNARPGVITYHIM